MRQMLESSGRVSVVHGEAERDLTSDEACGPLLEHPGPGLAKSKAGTGGLLEAVLTRQNLEAGQCQQRRSRSRRARHRANRPTGAPALARHPPGTAGRCISAQSGTQSDDSQTRREPARTGYSHGTGSTDPASTVASAATPDRPRLQRAQLWVSSGQTGTRCGQGRAKLRPIGQARGGGLGPGRIL